MLIAHPEVRSLIQELITASYMMTIFLPRPRKAGNPSKASWDSYRQAIITKLQSITNRPSTEEELSSFMDSLPNIKGIGDYSYEVAYIWLLDYLNITPEY